MKTLAAALRAAWRTALRAALRRGGSGGSQRHRHGGHRGLVVVVARRSCGALGALLGIRRLAVVRFLFCFILLAAGLALSSSPSSLCCWSSGGAFLRAPFSAWRLARRSSVIHLFSSISSLFSSSYLFQARIASSLEIVYLPV